jgi:putative ABC transport system permease protein
MVAFSILRALLPPAERDEVLAELRAEYDERAAVSRARADLWAWRQAVRSLPWLVRRSWDRGWTGWEAESNRMRPGGSMLERWVVDVRYALRRLRKRPTYTLLAVLTLALGVGGTAAVYGLVRTLLIDPLPYAEESDLAAFWMPYDWSQAEYLLLSSSLPPEVAGLAAYRPLDLTHTAPGAPAQLVKTIGASATLFDVLGVRPMLGPGFRPGDDRPGAETVAVLSWGFWQELGGDPEIVGRTVDLAGVPVSVVGVMPRDFWFPDATVRVWLPLPMNPENRSGNYAFIARFDGGAGGTAAATALPKLTRMLDEQFDYPPQWNKLASPVLAPLRDTLVASVRPALLATLGAMAIILLIASANVAALMVGQVEARTTEMAVRQALGASRRQLLQQVLAEAGALGMGAGIAGAVVAVATFGVLTSALPLGALAARATLDWSVFLTATAIALAAALAVSLVPAVALWRGDARDALATARTAGVRRGGRLESGLVIVEVALAVLMAAGAALLIRSVANLRAIDPGVNTRDVAVLDIVFGTEFDAAARQRLLRELRPQLEALPGVRSAAATQKLPLRGSGENWGISVRGVEAEEATTTSYRIVTPGYFDVIDQRIEAGRAFEERDVNGETVVVINRPLADRYFPGEDPLGRYIGTGYDTTWARIIGVVEHAADAGLTDEPSPSRYMLHAQLPFAPEGWSLVLRTEPGYDPGAVLTGARDVVRRAAPGVAVQTTTTMAAVFDIAMGPARQLMGLLLLLAGLAITLGALGVYGVVSHFVQRRRRDWSIRMALGLRPARLIGDIVRRGGVLVALGIAGGLIASTLFIRVLRSFLYGVGAADPIAFLLATTTLLAIGLFAAFVPARRASRADPAAVLREQ